MTDQVLLAEHVRHLLYAGRFADVLQLLARERPVSADAAADVCLSAAMAAQHLGQWDTARELAAVWARRGGHLATGPLVTLVVPTHDRPATLRRALRSIAAQLYRPIEVVVVNDAGRPVDDVLAEFENLLPLRLETHAENRYLAAARNTGMAVARGTWIGFLDDDDQLYPHHVGHLVHVLTTERTRAAASGACAILPAESQPRFEIYAPRPLVRGELLLENVIPVQSALIEHSLAREIGTFDTTLRANEDWEYWIRTARAAAWSQSTLVTSCVDKTDAPATMTGKGVASFLLAHADIYRRYDDELRAAGGATLAARVEQAMYCMALRTLDELVAEPAALVLVGPARENLQHAVAQAAARAFAPFEAPQAFGERLQVFHVPAVEGSAAAVVECARRAAGRWLVVSDAAALETLPDGWFAHAAAALAADRRFDALAIDVTANGGWWWRGCPRPASSTVTSSAMVSRKWLEGRSRRGSAAAWPTVLDAAVVGL